MDEGKLALTKQQHPKEVRALPAERPLLKSLAVLDEKEHMEQKIQACTQRHSEKRRLLMRSASRTQQARTQCSKETEICQKPPEFHMLEYKPWVEVNAFGLDDLHAYADVTNDQYQVPTGNEAFGMQHLD